MRLKIKILKWIPGKPLIPLLWKPYVYKHIPQLSLLNNEFQWWNGFTNSVVFVSKHWYQMFCILGQ